MENTLWGGKGGSRGYGKDMTALTAFGACAVASMLVFYWLEPRSPWFSLCFAIA